VGVFKKKKKKKAKRIWKVSGRQFAFCHFITLTLHSVSHWSLSVKIGGRLATLAIFLSYFLLKKARLYCYSVPVEERRRD
jgi:hypothetical protein